MAKSIYSAFKNDEARERTGVVIDLGETGKITVARAGGANARFEKRMVEITKPHRRSIQTGIIDKKTADGLLAQVYAETVVLGWEGLTDENGQALPFSKENAQKLLLDLPDLFLLIRTTSEDQTLFRQEVLEADAGN